MRTYNKWHGEIKRQLKKINLTHPQFVVLTSLGYLSQREKEVTQVMLSKISGMDVMSISQIIGTLEKKELIVRKEHSKDTRAKTVSITEAGQAILEKALPIVENIDVIFFGSLESKEHTFIELLNSLNSYKFD
ncbi:MarR family transcriptional regulator [Listeria monocytogenes]|nr:MarR family transcriptional regulator [Listeria monocytogenes]EAC8000758.1 MarR family transcriptional regulator [Listeria monocytogenes]EAC9519021.1 MarR family transcriptional regulator [Listeria monocytogenes]EAD7292601.1 MarR family transcriptional regulator [Listeria monocytogenes]EAD9140529.1 MarR family transcriptional regulator [Listeria monocytogenes]